MESRETSRSRPRTSGQLLLVLGLFLGACSGDDDVLAFNDTEVIEGEITSDSADDVGRSVGESASEVESETTDAVETPDTDFVEAGADTAEAADESETVDPETVEAEAEADAAATPEPTVTSEAPGEDPAVDTADVNSGDDAPAAETVTAAEEPEVDEPVADSPAEEDAAVTEEPGEAATDEVVETEPVEPVAGADSELVGTTGVTARELMRNLALELGGTAEISAEPERTDDGGNFAFDLTGDNGAVRRIDVVFAYVTSPDNAELIVGHEATGVSIAPA